MLNKSEFKRLENDGDDALTKLALGNNLGFSKIDVDAFAELNNGENKKVVYLPIIMLIDNERINILLSAEKGKRFMFINHAIARTIGLFERMDEEQIDLMLNAFADTAVSGIKEKSATKKSDKNKSTKH